MFKSMTLPRKLGVSFLAITIAAAIMMIVFGINISMISGSMERNNFSRTVHAKTIELETAILRQNSQMRGFLVTADTSYLKSYDEGREQYDSTSADLERMLVDPQERARVLESRKATLAWRRDWGDRMVAWTKAGRRTEAEQAVRDAGKAALVSDAVLPLRDLRDSEAASIERDSTRETTALTIAWAALALGGIALIGLAAALSRALGQSISHPITNLTATMSALASGDHDVAVPATDRGDELGAMARAVLVFKDAELARVAAVAEREQAMDEIGAALHRLADSDLTVRLEGLPAVFAAVAEDFNGALGRLCEVLGSVQGNVDTINTSAREIGQATSDLSIRSERQSGELQRSAITMGDITRQVSDGAQLAVQVNQAMVETRHEAQASGEVVKRAIQAMQQIDEASREIAEIIAVIDGIAFQTNLLALNAGVEAARAGDAGKGFAVVASEVRALAQRAADAANDVKSRINYAASHVASGVELVNETGGALGRIIERVASVSETVEEMSRSAAVQSSSLSEVNEAIHAMDTMTQQNAAMVEETTAATQSLAEEATRLFEAFASFHIAGASRAAPVTPIAPVRRQPAHRIQTPVISAPRGALAAAVRNDDWTEF